MSWTHNSVDLVSASHHPCDKTELLFLIRKNERKALITNVLSSDLKLWLNPRTWELKLHKLRRTLNITAGLCCYVTLT